MLNCPKNYHFFHYVSNSICLDENELYHKCNNPANDTHSNGNGNGNGNDTAIALEKCLYKSPFCLVFFHLQIVFIKFAISVRNISIFVKAREEKTVENFSSDE